MPQLAKNSKDLVPLKYARTMLRVADAQGCDINKLIRALQLPFDPLDESDPEAMIEAQYYTMIYNRVMWLLQDESFGMHLRQQTAAGTFRMMCMSIIHCSTLEHALTRAAEFNAFCRTLTGQRPISRRPILREEGEPSARYVFPAIEDLIREEEDSVLYSTHFMAIWRRFCGWLIGKNLEITEVWLQEKEDDNNSEFIAELFNCPIKYEQDFNAFILPDHYMDCPLVHTEETLKEFLRNAPYHLLVSSDEEDTSLIAQMKRIVGNDLSRDFPSVVDMASYLHMSVRTLRRRLKEQDTTYQQFKDNLRKEHAIRWLNQPELKINAVSALLGFDEPSAFHRSFKKWTGMTPGEYRNTKHSAPQNTADNTPEANNT